MKDWEETKKQMNNLTDEWQKEGRTYLAIVNERKNTLVGQQTAIAFGGDKFFLGSMLLSAMKGNKDFAMVIKRAAALYKIHEIENIES